MSDVDNLVVLLTGDPWCVCFTSQRVPLNHKFFNIQLNIYLYTQLQKKRENVKIEIFS